MKKSILTVAMVIAGLAAQAQVNWSVDSKVDDFNGWTRYATNTVKKALVKSDSKFYNASLSFVHFSGDEEVYIRVTPNYSAGCSGSRSNYMILLLENGDPIRLEEDLSDISCSSGSTSIYRLPIESIKDQVVTKVRFAQTEGYVDFDQVNGFVEGVVAVTNHE